MKGIIKNIKLQLQVEAKIDELQRHDAALAMSLVKHYTPGQAARSAADSQMLHIGSEDAYERAYEAAHERMAAQRKRAHPECGGEKKGDSGREVKRRVGEVAEGRRPAPPAQMVEKTIFTNIRKAPVAKLRTLCNERGLSEVGNGHVLLARLWEWEDAHHVAQGFLPEVHNPRTAYVPNGNRRGRPRTVTPLSSSSSSSDSDLQLEAGDDLEDNSQVHCDYCHTGLGNGQGGTHVVAGVTYTVCAAEYCENRMYADLALQERLNAQPLRPAPEHSGAGYQEQELEAAQAAPQEVSAEDSDVDDALTDSDATE